MTLSPYSADCLSMKASGKARYVASKRPWYCPPRKWNILEMWQLFKQCYCC
jgi:hypothetical protein